MFLITEMEVSKIVKKCKIHGDLTIDQTRKDGDKLRCKACRLASNAKFREKNREILVEKNMIYKAQNRDIVNAWNKKDRQENPEKYRKYEANYIIKHGIEKVRKKEVARLHGISIAQYNELHEKQKGLCEICGNPESRTSRSGNDKMPLCLDHCHTCKDKGKHIIRGLLCHNCNSAMGKLHDDIDILKSMISYLERHKHIMDDSTGVIQ